MSVPVGKRGTNKLDVFVKAEQLAKHTIELTNNKKNFPGRYQKVIDELVENAWGIADDIWTANNIYVGKGCDPRNIQDRLYLQNRAITRCKRLLFNIQMAHKFFHRSTKSTKYWTELTQEVLELCRAWRDTDVKRLKSKD